MIIDNNKIKAEALEAISLDTEEEILELEEIIAVARQAEFQHPDVKVETLLDTVDELLFEPNGFKTEPFFGHFCIADNLYNCLSGAEEPFVKPEETINVSAILEAAYLSAKEKREVKIAELRRF